MKPPPPPNKLKEFNRMHREIRKITESLSKEEIEIYAAHFYQYLVLHKKNKKDGSYNKWRAFINTIVMSDLKQFGDYGHYLLSSVIYKSEDEFSIIENRIALRK